jgi:uncharacterized membrane protein
MGASEIVLAVHVAGLFAAAERSEGVIEVLAQVGDFVAVNEPLFNLYGGASVLDDRDLTGFVAIGPERTIEQDPTFAYRIVIDIALKALSPAINDPTTATLAIDQLHRLLRMVGTRHLGNDEVRNSAAAVRLIFRTPNWEDYVHLSFTEIRHCGANSIQVVRRLRAMIENLLQTLPPHRQPMLREELRLLDCEIENHYANSEDATLARMPDTQGLGGHYRTAARPN